MQHHGKPQGAKGVTLLNTTSAQYDTVTEMEEGRWTIAQFQPAGSGWEMFSNRFKQLQAIDRVKGIGEINLQNTLTICRQWVTVEDGSYTVYYSLGPIRDTNTQLQWGQAIDGRLAYRLSCTLRCKAAYDLANRNWPKPPLFFLVASSKAPQRWGVTSVGTSPRHNKLDAAGSKWAPH